MKCLKIVLACSFSILIFLFTCPAYADGGFDCDTTRVSEGIITFKGIGDFYLSNIEIALKERDEEEVQEGIYRIEVIIQNKEGYFRFTKLRVLPDKFPNGYDIVISYDSQVTSGDIQHYRALTKYAIYYYLSFKDGVDEYDVGNFLMDAKYAVPKLVDLKRR